mgnify:CR=1 FL=1
MAYYPKASGIGSSAAYQVAGRPYLTGSIVQNGDGSQTNSQQKVVFPAVTRSIQLVNTGTVPVLLHFDDRTEAPALIAEHNYLVVPPDLVHCGSGSSSNFVSGSFKNTPTKLDIKCSHLYVSSAGMGQSGFQLAAELTHIPTADMYTLSGSGINTGN